MSDKRRQITFVQTAYPESCLASPARVFASWQARKDDKNLTLRTITCNSKKHILSVVLFSSNPENSINLILDLKLNVIFCIHITIHIMIHEFIMLLHICNVAHYREKISIEITILFRVVFVCFNKPKSLVQPYSK